jgi:hypothetical protein
MALGFTAKSSAAAPVTPYLTWDKALLALIIGQVFWRVFCEQLILLFSIHESLKNNHAGSSNRK